MEIFKDVTASTQNEGSTPKRAKKRPPTLEVVMQQLQQMQEGITSMGTEIADLREEIHDLRTQLSEKEKEIRSQELASPTPRTSYASVLRETSHLTPHDSPSCNPATPQPDNNMLHPVQINMTRPDLDAGNLSGTYDLPTIRRELESLWKECVETSGIKCRVVKSTKEHTLKLLFKTHADAMAIRKHTGWLKENFLQARIEGEQWFPVKVDRVNKLSLKDLHDEHIHEELCKQYGRENGEVEIKRMRWLGSKPHLLYGSLVVYLSRKEDADRLLHNQTMEFQGESGFTKQFIRRVTPQRCFKCQAYGHHQLRCRGDLVCGHCAETGHERSDCMTPSPKCASCLGPHQSSDPGCPTYRKMLAEITPDHLYA